MANKYAVFNADGVLSQRLIEGLHDIPKGAVRVNEQLWLSLINEVDGIWMRGGDGVIKKEQLQVVSPDYAVIERQWRDLEIGRVVWLRDRHRDEKDIGKATSIAPEQFEELLGYIQSLRDWPESDLFPAEELRPKVPAWVVNQTQ